MEGNSLTLQEAAWQKKPEPVETFEEYRQTLPRHPKAHKIVCATLGWIIIIGLGVAAYLGTR